MSTYANPPKLRSYVDHKPHTASDNLIQWGRKFDTYFDHWPVDGTDLFFKPNRAGGIIANGYIDHFARPGDLNQM